MWTTTTILFQDISKKAIFTTGINIFDKNEQLKLQERAKRFALRPEEIHSFTDQDFQELRESLGVNSSNEKEFKFDTVHLLGLEEMSAEDIVDYFSNYAPEGIEWIDNGSCNVVWLDSLSAARALYYKSRVVRGMPAREPKTTFPEEFLDSVDEPEEESGKSILIKNKNREIELRNEIGEIILPKQKNYPENSVDISEITIPIPPGYWRLGNPHPKSKCLLLRFGKTSDRLPFRSEKCNKYFKKLTTQGYRSVISESKKKELRSIFERNKELNQNKNPWESLAKNWDKDSQFREREPVFYTNKEDDEVQIVEVKNPKLKARLGSKRKHESEGEKSDSESTDVVANRILVPEKKTTKVPRMKMYADEEEENQKRRKILMSIKKQTEEIDQRESQVDLRNVLGPASRYLTKSPVPKEDTQVDLSTRLKNRTKKMTFAVETEPDYYAERAPRLALPDARRDIIERMRYRDPDVTRSIFIVPKKDVRERLSPERPTIREKTHRHRSSRRSPVMTLHSDRIPSSKSTHSRRRRSKTPEKRREKTKSKITIPKKPTVASTIWSKVSKSSASEDSSSDSESGSASDSSSELSSSSDSGSDSEGGSDSSSSRSSHRKISARNPDRPGFDKSRLSQKVNHKSPLKITTTNEHFRQRKSRR